MELLYSQIKSDFLSSTRSQSYFDVLLTSLTEHGLFSSIKSSSTSKDGFISHINSSLSVRSSHIEGLSLLYSLLRQCSNEILEENFKTWMDLLMKILESHIDHDVVKPLCRVLSQLLSMVTAIPELSRNFVTSTLPRLLTILVDSKSNFPEEEHCAVLEICTCCIVHFGSPCRPFKNKIEQYCTKYLGSKVKQSRELAAECFALVARCGLPNSGGDRNSNGMKMVSKEAESWSTTLNRVLKTLDSVLDQLYADFEVDNRPIQSDKSTESIIFQKLSNSEPSSHYILLAQFSGLTTVLRVMLNQDFPAVVSLNIEQILAVMCRILSVIPRQILNRPVPDGLRLLTVMPQLYTEAIDVCCALVHATGTNFIPYSGNVCQMTIEMLSGYDCVAKSQQSNRFRPYMSLRCSIYTLLSVMVKELGMGCGLVTSKELCNRIVQQILKDVEIKPNALLCSAQTKKSDASGSFNKKKSNKRGDQRVEASYTAGIGASKLLSSDEDICVAGLETLRSLIIYCGVYLNASHCENIKNFCIGTLKEVQKGEIGCVPLPYNCANCRLALYQLLKALLISHCMNDTSRQVSMKLFSRGLQDPDIETRSGCREAVAICQCLTQLCIVSDTEAVNIESANQSSSIRADTVAISVESANQSSARADTVAITVESANQSSARADTEAVNVESANQSSARTDTEAVNIESANQSSSNKRKTVLADTEDTSSDTTNHKKRRIAELETPINIVKTASENGVNILEDDETIDDNDDDDDDEAGFEKQKVDKCDNNVDVTISTSTEASSNLKYSNNNASTADEKENSECLQQMLSTFVNEDSESD